ncbi:hypothetical protein DES32_2812 [Methylovirgula ligni]|uniref:SGNH/GDSL hydrolase family protein n=1 Tax=Methylovirgula ligni TaxID=569860 RepID=A0A3D9YQ13_9HYPH|nr:SGNH/GDSL hydrolase family protein [Methylovirgula ligni]REF84700.1 hypothetical protein DES32_2812 [Methylovirgula ligni]
MKKALGLGLRLVAVLILIAGIVYLETSRSLPAFRFWTFVLFAIALAFLTSFLRGGWRDGALVATSLAFGLCAVEGVATLLSPPPVVHSPRGFIVPWAPLGWQPGHAGQFHVTRIDPKSRATIYDVTYSIDRDHLRQTRSCASGPTVGFFGCSFTFGEGLNDADTLPQQVSDSFGDNLRVLNFGLPGYGPHQFLREMQLGVFDGLLGSQPKLFVYLTAPWHAERTACKSAWGGNGPRYALVDGKAVYQGRCMSGLKLGLHEWAEHSAAYRVFIERNFDQVTHADIELYIRILLDSAHLAQTKYGVPLVIAYMRAPPGYLRATGFTDDEIIARLRAGAPYVFDVSLPEKSGKPLTLAGDPHPNAYANNLRAAMLKDYIIAHFGPALSLSAEGQAPLCRAAH